MRAQTLVLAAIVAVAGCSTPAPDRASGVEPPRQLVATLVSPIDVELRWTVDDPGAAGRIVEFATEPGGPFTTLQFMPPGQTSYRHPDLMPQTPFYYRLRAIFGPATPAVDVTLPAGDFDEKSRQDGHEWAEPRTVSRGTVAAAPIRAAGTAQAGAPTDLRAKVMHANGIWFTWTDHASDEEGYLVEVRRQGHDDYAVAALLDPDINSFGLVTLPEEKKASYRVRAFYYGQPSNVAHQKTGAQPPGR